MHRPATHFGEAEGTEWSGAEMVLGAEARFRILDPENQRPYVEARGAIEEVSCIEHRGGRWLALRLRILDGPHAGLSIRAMVDDLFGALHRCESLLERLVTALQQDACVLLCESRTAPCAQCGQSEPGVRHCRACGTRVSIFGPSPGSGPPSCECGFPEPEKADRERPHCGGCGKRLLQHVRGWMRPFPPVL